MYKVIVTTETASTKNTVILYQDILDVPVPVLTDLYVQTIEVVALGNGVNSADSVPTIVYRVNPGIPESNSYIDLATDTLVCTIKQPKDLIDTPLFSDSKLNTTIKYKIVTYNYLLNEVSETEPKTITDSEQEFKLQLGQSISFWVDCQLKEDSDLTSKNTFILPMKKLEYTNYKTLNAPLILHNSNNCITAQHCHFINDPIQGINSTLYFSYNILRNQKAIFKNDIITTDLSDRAGIILLSGDELKVKSVAKYYNDSLYSIFIQD